MHFYYDLLNTLSACGGEIHCEPATQLFPRNQPLRVKARSLVYYWTVRDLGMSGTSVGKLLSLGQPAVSRAVVRAEKLAQDLKLSLVE